MKIILGTDGSEFSDAAADKCSEMFGSIDGAQIRVVCAFEEVQVIAAEPFALSPEYYQAMADAARKQAEHFAQTTVERMKDRCEKASVSHEVLTGKPANCIVEFAKEWNADLIVVGSHGRGFWGRMLGSVSNGVVNHAPCSVIVVRKSAE